MHRVSAAERLRQVDLLLRKIFAAYARQLAAGQPPTRAQVLDAAETMSLHVALSDGETHESFGKQCFEVLERVARDALQSAYAPYLQAAFAGELTDQTYLNPVQSFVQVSLNFADLKAFVAKFYLHFDKKTYQKLALLDRTSAVLLQDVFAAMLAGFLKVLKALLWHVFSQNLDRPTSADSAATFTAFLRGLTEAAVAMPAAERVRSELEAEIRKVYELRAKTSLQHALTLPASECLAMAAEFKAGVRRNGAFLVEEVPELAGLRPQTQAILNRELLDPLVARLNKDDFAEISAVLDGRDERALAALFALFVDAEDKIERFKDFFTRFISRRGARLLAEPQPEGREVEAFLCFLAEVEGIVTRHFHGNRQLRWAVNKATENVMAELGASRSRTLNEAFAARVLGFVLGRFQRREPVSETTPRLADMVSYLGPSAFRKVVVGYLSRRVFNHPNNRPEIDAELALLQPFRHKMGDECCASLLALLKELDDFQATKAESWARFREDLGLPELAAMQMEVAVVARHLHQPPFAVVEPVALRFWAKVLGDFFLHKLASSNQKLDLDLTAGHMETQLEWKTGRVVLAGNPLYSVLAMHLGERGPMGAAEILKLADQGQSTKPAETAKEVEFYLAKLVESGVVSRQADKLALEPRFFTGDKGTLRLPHYEPSADQTAPEVEERAERHAELESRIMRLVKQRPVAVDELRAAVQTEASRFDLESFRASLQQLVQGDYVELTGPNQEVVKFR